MFYWKLFTFTYCFLSNPALQYTNYFDFEKQNSVLPLIIYVPWCWWNWHLYCLERLSFPHFHKHLYLFSPSLFLPIITLSPLYLYFSSVLSLSFISCKKLQPLFFLSGLSREFGRNRLVIISVVTFQVKKKKESKEVKCVYIFVRR